MNIEHLLFVMYLFPTIIGIIYAIRYTSDEILSKRKEKMQKKGNERYLFEKSLFFILFVIPYYGAYIYADLKYIWLILAIIYTLLAIFSIIATGYCWYQKTYNTEEYASTINKLNKQRDNNNENIYPKLRARISCGIKITSIILWLFSWRHIFA